MTADTVNQHQVNDNNAHAEQGGLLARLKNNPSNATGFFFSAAAALLVASGLMPKPKAKDEDAPKKGGSPLKAIGGALAIFSGLSYFVKRKPEIIAEDALLAHLSEHADKLLLGEDTGYARPELNSAEKFANVSDKAGSLFASVNYVLQAGDGVANNNPVYIASGTANALGYAWHVGKKPEDIPVQEGEKVGIKPTLDSMRRNPSKTAAIGSLVGSVLGLVSGIMDFFNPKQSKLGSLLQAAAYSSYVTGDMFLSQLSKDEKNTQKQLANHLVDKALQTLSGGQQESLKQEVARENLVKFLTKASGVDGKLIGEVLASKVVEPVTAL